MLTCINRSNEAKKKGKRKKIIRKKNKVAASWRDLSTSLNSSSGYTSDDFIHNYDRSSFRIFIYVWDIPGETGPRSTLIIHVDFIHDLSRYYTNSEKDSTFFLYNFSKSKFFFRFSKCGLKFWIFRKIEKFVKKKNIFLKLLHVKKKSLTKLRMFFFRSVYNNIMKNYGLNWKGSGSYIRGPVWPGIPHTL